MIAMDAETMRIVAELKQQRVPIAQEICISCHQPTIYILNDKATNKPMNCGAMACMRKAKDRLVREWP